MTDFGPLHNACIEGNVDLVQKLMFEHKANITDSYNNTPLHVAALHGQLEAALVLINRFGCDVNIKGHKGRSVFHQACAGGNVRLVQYLILEYKADIFSRDDENNTPLHVAAISGADKVVSALIKQFKCDVDAKGNYDRSVLHCACYNGHLNVITAIGKYASVLAVDDDGNTPLHVCSARGHVECVKALLALNAPILATNREGNTPREVAQHLVKTEIDKYLLDKFGYSVSRYSNSERLLLHDACKKGHIGLIQKLIFEHKADVDAKNENSITPLHVAALYGKKEAVSTLIDQFKCDIGVKSYHGRSFLHLACHYGHSNVITAIGKSASLLAAADDDGNTPLHKSCASGDVECVKALLALDAPILVTNKKGNTPRDVAWRLVKTEIDKYLFDKFGYSVSRSGNRERLLLHNACKQGDVGIIQKLILEHKANVDARDGDNNTPLHVAALYGNEEAVLTLINQFKCDVKRKGSKNRSVLHQACIGGNTSLVHDLILYHKADITARDDDGNTPFHVAKSLTSALIKHAGCIIKMKGYNGQTLLHKACSDGNVSLVQSLVQEHKADANVRDNDNNTPLHVAALHGNEEAALTLINQFGFNNVDIKGYQDRSVLHQACIGGNVSLIETLIYTHKASVTARDCNNDTPLHVAASSCLNETLDLIRHIGGGDIDMKGYNGQTLLHKACSDSNVTLVQSLVHEYNANIDARDDDNNTPLHVAALHGKEQVLLILIHQFKCDIDMKGYCGRSFLHCACSNGNSNVVTAVGSKYASLSAIDDDGNTPLHISCASGHVECVKALLALDAPILVINKDGNTPREVAKHFSVITEINKYIFYKFSYSVSHYGNSERLLLHDACKLGNVGKIQKILEHKANVYYKDGDNNTPLHVAALHGNEEAAQTLINQFGFNNVDIKGYKDRSVLHQACISGNVSLIRTLILSHKASVTARDYNNDTPLHVAVSSCLDETLTSIQDIGCDIEMKGYNGQTLLHKTCSDGNISLVWSLVHKHKANINARDNDNNIPLHVAALYGKEQVMNILIDQFKCDVDVKGYHGRSALHHACHKGHDKVVSAIGKYASLLAVDDDGNTPLHECCARGHVECVKVLLKFNAPVFVRNKNGMTPREIAEKNVVPIIDNYVLQNRGKILADYKKMQARSKKRYSKPEHITRIFVIGNPGAGKSSFVQCLKREGFFKSFRKVSESSVPRHTAGIVPSEYHSRHYGRVLFYDFAGDPEYYSSHAAILENLSFLKKGDNIFVIIADLNENDTTINNLLHYWFSFIQNQKFLEEIVSLVLIGSHVDSVTKVVLQDKKKIFVDFQKYVKSRVSYKSSYHFLDCRKPRDIGDSDIQQSIKDLTADSSSYSLSLEASILLGLLEKDFKSVTASTLKILISHISDTGLALPKNPKSLRPILHELHELGLLLVIGKSKIEGDVQIVLNISQLTNDVHRLLFSKASINLGFFSNFGIVPESSLLKILPKYITKECLIQLQYCQEISHRDIGVFSFPSQSCTPDKSFLFFPSLCSVEKSEVSWKETFSDAKLDYSIGWLAECTDASNHFPPRFLHVLLLRLIFKFSFKHLTSDGEQYHHHCTLWKTGVQWPMEEGVLCMVELTDNSKKLVVVTKSEEALAYNCISVFNRIICCVMEAKAEFCHSIKPNFFLLATTEEANYLDQDNLIALYKVEEVLNSPETKEFIFSVTGKKSIRCSKISCMHKLTHWNTLFPIDFKSVLSYLKDVVRDLHNLSDYLNIPHSVMEAIEIKYPRDVDRWRKELVVKWMSSTSDPPCWWHLVEALKKIDKNVLAAKIEEENYSRVELQKKLLDQGNHSLKPDVEFIELFSEVIESDWSFLTSLLLLTSNEIEEVKEEGEGLSQEHHAHLMLKKWVSREDATYGQLYQKLKTISLFQY